MVPDGWERAELGALLDFQNGVNTEAVNYGRGSKFVNVMDIFQNRFLTQECIRGTVTVSPRQDAAYALKRGDILFNRTSETFDEIALSSVYLDDAHAIFGGFVIRGRPKNDKLLPEFSCYCFSSDEVRREMIRRGQGAIRANIGQGDLGDVPLLLPPLPEQKKIAEILSTWDKSIETTEKLLANAEAQKRALMQKLLTGKRRLKGFEGSEWNMQVLGKMGHCIRGVSYKPDQIEQEETAETIRLYRSTNIQNGEIVDTDVVLLPTSQVTPNRILRTDDLAVCMSNGSKNLVGKAAPVHDATGRQTVGAFCSIFRPNGAVPPNFVQLLFSSALYRQQLRIILAGSSINNLKSADIENMAFNVPVDVREMQAIATVIETATSEVKTRRVQLMALEREKQALMQQLLTGKRRVTV